MKKFPFSLDHHFSRAGHCLAGAGVYLTFAAGVAFAAEEPAAKALEFQVAARSFGITYSLDKDGALLSELRDFEQNDADHPVKGQVFPSRFIRTLNRYCHCPRYTGPLGVSLPNGDTSLPLIYDSHAVGRESDDIEHTTIVVRDRDHPIFIELHIRSYQKDNILEQWVMLRNECRYRSSLVANWKPPPVSLPSARVARGRRAGISTNGCAVTECAMATACVRWTTTPGRAAA